MLVQELMHAPEINPVAAGSAMLNEVDLLDCVCLQKRGCPLIGIHGSPSLEEQRKRFTQHNWQSAWAEDMDTVYTKHTDPQDRRR